ncbi:MAG: hypothetical protein JNK65_02855 [Deltaproteobacteria bacterium]|nr:hypothetical protein [Deltaproteobacteria bacterium]
MTHNLQNEFPNINSLWENALQASIIHAIMIAQYPDLSHEQSWEGSNYSVQDSAGSRGTICFDTKNPRRFVAVFSNTKSSRRIEDLFRSFPQDLNDLRKEALEYCLEEYQEIIQPSITTAFWSNEGKICAAEAWQNVLKNGANLIERQLLEPEPAFNAWKEYYNMNAESLELARMLFKLKLSFPHDRIAIDYDWIRFLTKEEGFDGTSEAFKEIGMFCQKNENQ